MFDRIQLINTPDDDFMTVFNIYYLISFIQNKYDLLLSTTKY